MSEKIGYILIGGVIGLIVGMCLIYAVIYLPVINSSQLRGVFGFIGGFLAGFLLMHIMSWIE